MDVKEQIKRRVPILEVVRLYVDLKPAGKYYKGLCPFHTEKTPSFHVMPEKDTFACYGCNTFGDIFTFIQQVENLTFPEAMDFLIDKFNVPVERDREKHTPKVDKDVYKNINEIALAYFKNTLANSPKARAYLDERGMNQDTIQRFALGYAENDWDGLKNHLTRKSVDLEKAEELGLLIRGKSDSLYDRFRGRIMFPIFSESGTIIAFGGRTIFNEDAKYLNSPDSPVYQKSDHLYAFHLTKNAVKEKKSAILVEGYFDVISLYQYGIHNVTASLGTALTERQTYLLKRYAENIFMLYDSDAAGVKATARGIEIMFQQNVNPRVIQLKDAKDPDEFVREYGREALEEEMDRAIDGFRFLLKQVEKDIPDWRELPERKKEAVEKIRLSLEKIEDNVMKDGYKGMAADFFMVDLSEFQAKEKPRRQVKSPVSGEIDEKTNGSEMLEVTPAERLFIESLLRLPNCIENFKGLCSNDLLSVLASGNILRQVFKHFDKELGHIDYHRVTIEMTPAEKALARNIFEAVTEAAKNDVNQLLQDIESAFLGLQGIFYKREKQKINREIKLAERENDLEKVEELMARKYKFMKTIYDKKKKQED